MHANTCCEEDEFPRPSTGICYTRKNDRETIRLDIRSSCFSFQLEKTESMERCWEVEKPKKKQKPPTQPENISPYKKCQPRIRRCDDIWLTSWLYLEIIFLFVVGNHLQHRNAVTRQKKIHEIENPIFSNGQR